MGHAAGNSDMSAVYRQTVSDERLLGVVNTVWTWLFGEHTNHSPSVLPYRVIG
jgi:hypothetical protein